MKFTLFLLSAACLLCSSCSSKPDSKNNLYAFEVADAARKNWTSPNNESKPIPSLVDTNQKDSVHTDSIPNLL